MPIAVDMKVNWAERNLEIQAEIECEYDIDELFLKYAINHEGNRWKTSSMWEATTLCPLPLIMQLISYQLMPLGSLWLSERLNIQFTTSCHRSSFSVSMWYTHGIKSDFSLFF